jgi:hypothetical protein
LSVDREHGVKRGQDGGTAVPSDGDADGTLVEAARAALQRDVIGLRAAASALPSGTPSSPYDHAGLADLFAAFADILARFEADERLSDDGRHALRAGESALQREADGWRSMAAIATSNRWRAQFEAHAAEAQRLADGIRALRQQLVDRDREAK